MPRPTSTSITSSALRPTSKVRHPRAHRPQRRPLLSFHYISYTLPTLASSVLPPDTPRRNDEELINRSLLDSLDAQADAEPIFSSDSEPANPSYGSASGSSSGSPSIPYHYGIHPNQHQQFSDSPPDHNNHALLHHHQDSLFNLQSSQTMYNSLPSTHQEFISDLDAQGQQQGMKLSSFPMGPYRSSTNFSSAFSTNRPRLPISTMPSKPYRDTPALFSPTSNDSFHPPRMASPTHGLPFDPRSSFDLTPTHNSNVKQSYVMNDYNSVLASHNPFKSNSVSQQPHVSFSSHSTYGPGNVISQTPYGPHLPLINSAPTNGTSTSAANLSHPNGTLSGQQSGPEEISTIFVVGFPEDMQEREFQNMFTFSPGFEAATLKIPNKEFTAYNGIAGGLRGSGAVNSIQMSYSQGHDNFNSVSVQTDSASWPSNGVTEDQFGSAGANGSNANIPPRKQIIGFAKFRTREQALDARDVLQGRRVDIEKGAVLKAEMAKKNLHTKRGVGPTLSGASGLVIGAPSLLNGIGLPAADPTFMPSLSTAPAVPDGLTVKEREIGTLGAMGLTSWSGRIHDTSKEDGEREKERERKQREAGILSAMGIGSAQRGARIRAEEHERERERKKERERFQSATLDGLHSVTHRQASESGLQSPVALNSMSINSFDTPTLPTQSSDDLQSPWNDPRKESVPGRSSSQRSSSPQDVSSAALSPTLPQAQREGQSHSSVVGKDLSAAIEALVVSTGNGNTSPQLPSPESSSGSGSNKNTSIDQNPPINTLYVGNLPTSPPPSGFPHDHLEESLRELFSRQPGFRRFCFRTKNNGPMCFVEFEDVNYATRALNDLYGNTLNGLVKGGGIRLSYSKNPLGVRTPTSAGSNCPTLQQQQASLGDQMAFSATLPLEAFQARQAEATPTAILRRDTVSSISSPLPSQQTFGSFMMSSPPPRFASPPSAALSNFSNSRALFPRCALPFVASVGSSSFSPFGIDPSSNPLSPSMIPDHTPDHDHLFALRDQQQHPSPQHHFSLEATRAS